MPCVFQAICEILKDFSMVPKELHSKSQEHYTTQGKMILVSFTADRCWNENSSRGR